MGILQNSSVWKKFNSFFSSSFYISIPKNALEHFHSFQKLSFANVTKMSLLSNNFVGHKTKFQTSEKERNSKSASSHIDNAQNRWALKLNTVCWEITWFLIFPSLRCLIFECVRRFFYQIKFKFKYFKSMPFWNLLLPHAALIIVILCSNAYLNTIKSGN